MPNISEFDAPSNLGLQPSETGVEATARAAQRINMYGSQEAQDLTQTGDRIGRGVASVGEAAVQYMEHREISTIGKNASMIRLGLENQLAEKLKDPNFDPDDPSFAQKFIEENVNKTLDDFQSGPITEGGQKFAQQEADHMRSQMATQVHAVSSKLAGDAIINNVKETANNSAGAAFINPASVFDSMAMFDRTLHAKASTSPNLDAEGYARVMSESGYAGKSQIARAAIQGTIINGGDWKKLASDPRISPYVNQAETMGFVRQEKQYQTSMRIAGNQERIQQHQIAEDTAHASISDSWSKNVSIDDTTGRVNINPQFLHDMAQLPAKNPNAPDAVEKAKTYIDWAESQQKPPPVRDNPQTVDGLLATASDPTKSLDDVKIATAKADIAKGITPQTRTQISQLAQDMRNINDPFVKNALEAAKDQINPTILKGLNADKYAAFYYDFIHNQYMPAKVAGTLPGNALDTGDPKSMISMAITKATGGAAGTLGPSISANGGIGAAPEIKVGTEKTFKQGVGVWDGKQWAPKGNQ